jgi:hypothetical protein
MAECPVVTIDTPAGPTRINACDYDPDKHTLCSGESIPQRAPEDPVAEVAQDVPSVAEHSEESDPNARSTKKSRR